MRELMERQLRALEVNGKRPDGPLGELYDDLVRAIYDSKQSAMEPLRDKVHDVPTIEDTVMERTFTSTFVSRLRNRIRGK